MSRKVGTAMKKKRKRIIPDNNRNGKICISVIMLVFMLVMSVQIAKVYEKENEKREIEQALSEELKKEQAREQELKEYEKYINSKEYIEDIAQSNLGLIYEDQIIFREIQD